jgi:hypothetical protein
VEIGLKYIVIKRTDIEEALKPMDFLLFVDLVSAIQAHRDMQGKPENTYLVINQDEPYYADVVKIMEQYNGR